MNVAAVIDLISASCTGLFAFIWLRVSRAPGWGDTRWLAAVAGTAALYSVCDFTQVAPVDDVVVRWGGRLSVSLAGLHCGAWLLYLEARDRRPLGRFERLVAWSGVAVAVAALVPGLLFTDAVTSFEVSWLGITFRTPTLSAPGQVGGLYFLLAMATLTPRALRRWRDGWTFRVPALGVVFLLLLGLNDALATARLIQSPLLLDLGFLVFIVGHGLSELSRLIRDARSLELLSGRLELQVEARTSELALTQRALAASEKLAAIGQLAAGIAHEINNPAAVVLSNLRYVSQSAAADEKLPDDAIEALEDATRSTERIVQVVRELSAAGRVASRSTQAPGTPCDVEAVVARVCGQLAELVPSAPAVQVKDTRGVFAVAEAAVLEQVLLSVLDNAALAVAGRDAAVIEVSVVLDERQVHLVVRDNGAGVSPEALPHLFEPFFTTRPQGRGTGMGLAISLGLISSQGGDLRLLDTSPEGSRFQLSAPRAQASGS